MLDFWLVVFCLFDEFSVSFWLMFILSGSWSSIILSRILPLRFAEEPRFPELFRFSEDLSRRRFTSGVKHVRKFVGFLVLFTLRIFSVILTENENI